MEPSANHAEVNSGVVAMVAPDSRGFPNAAGFGEGAIGQSTYSGNRPTSSQNANPSDASTDSGFGQAVTAVMSRPR